MKKLKQVLDIIIGWYKVTTTGKCGLLLYYQGCGCEQCMARQKNEYNELTKNR